jgi:phospholipid/cholesterol/gamma-HCH transport system substrate-binding protein
MNHDRRTEIKVGLFVLGLGAAGLVGVLLLGKSRHVFESHVKLHATFTDVSGLVQGAPVRIGGVNVGTVSQIQFVRAQPRPLVRVDLEVTERAIGLIRTDSVARIEGQGLLGDKIVEVSAGSITESPVAPGGEVRAVAAPDLDHMLQQAAAVLDDARRAADRAAVAVETVLDPFTVKLVQESIAHIHGLLHTTEKGEGLAHALFYDKRTADEVTRLASNLSQLTTHVDRGVQHLDAVLAATDQEGRQLLNNVSRAAHQVGETAEQIQKTHVLANLERASGDLAQMTAYMKAGQGTLGALVVDPTVYEQLVQVLGGVGRSRILRALVRYAISRDQGRGVGRRVIDDENVPEVKAPRGQPEQVKRPRDSAKR